MKIFAQNSRCPSQVLFSFDEVADPSVEQVRWAVAYSTRRGCERLVERVSTRMGKLRWEKSQKHFVSSLDFGLTEPGALEFLSSLPGSDVRIANPEVVSKPGLMPGKAYHPKLYLFDSADATGYVVGSANLTDDAKALTKDILRSGVLPADADRDAAHIALATVHEMDILLSWNCRHIANATIQARLRKLAEAAGFTLPVVCTPEELMENDNEQND